MKRFSTILSLIALPALCLFAPIPALYLFAPIPARADALGDQVKSCNGKLTPGSRAAIIAACNQALQPGKLAPILAGPAHLARGLAYATLPADFGKALTDFSAASDMLPKNPAPLNAAGIVLLKQRKLEEAFGAFDAARLLDGRNPTALYGRGLSRMAMGQGGQKDMDQATGYDPGIAAFFKANDLYP